MKNEKVVVLKNCEKNTLKCTSITYHCINYHHKNPGISKNKLINRNKFWRMRMLKREKIARKNTLKCTSIKYYCLNYHHKNLRISKIKFKKIYFEEWENRSIKKLREKNALKCTSITYYCINYHLKILGFLKINE